MSDAMPDKFDRLLGQLHGLPDTMSTKPSTVRTIQPLGIGGSQLFIVQMWRQQTRDEDGKITDSRDTVFLETVDEGGSLRIVLPPQVVDVIVRQRDALSGRSKSRAAKARAADLKARGVKVGFARKR